MKSPWKRRSIQVVQVLVSHGCAAFVPLLLRSVDYSCCGRDWVENSNKLSSRFISITLTFLRKSLTHKNYFDINLKFYVVIVEVHFSYSSIVIFRSSTKTTSCSGHFVHLCPGWRESQWVATPRRFSHIWSSMGVREVGQTWTRNDLRFIWSCKVS